MFAFSRFSRPKPARLQIVPTISNKPCMNVFDLRQRLVSDYRGRQGADEALLIRRCRQPFSGHDITCIGTSATIDSKERK
jgi:hypothetical protein